ncbi:MAG: TonB-dependent receptor [Elusimicrobia bacterium]|nr:TonB-dependent receptor [Elusimicrobiota bacterium]
MNKKLIFSLAFIAALPAPRPAAAQDESSEFWSFMAEEASNLTVAADKPETVFDSVSNVTVIDRTMIERYNFASVADALETLPGMMVLRTYLLHNLPTIRGALQEHYADKVLVMINNVPMWNAVTGEGDLDRVGIDAVERIEVLLGPASVLYGSNALTGAINIVLREPAGENKSLGLLSGGLGSAAGGYGGNADVSRAGGLYAWKGKKASYTLAADSYNRAQPMFRFRDEARAANAVKEYLNARSFNFTGSRGNDTVLVNVSRGEQNFLGNTITLASGELFSQVREAALASYLHDFAPGWGDLKYTVTYDWQRRNIPRDANDNVRSDIEGARFVNTLSGRRKLGKGFYLEGGGTHEYRHARSYLNYYSNTDVPVWDNSLRDRVSAESSAHSQLGYESGDWKLLAGSRYTHNTGAGDNLSSRVSAVRLFDEGHSLKAMFSQSFRSPTPFERFFKPAPVTVVGNPGLKPEKAETFELSCLASGGRFFGHFTAYHTRYRDSIFRNLGNFTRDGTVYTNINFYANAPAYSSSGVELEGRYESRRTRAFAAATFLRGSRGDEHTIPAPGVFGLTGGSSWNFKYVPAYTVSAGFSRDIGNFYVSSRVTGYGRNRSLRGDIGSQFWADAGAGYKKGAVRHALAVRNLTGRAVMFPEYVRQRVVETVPLYTGRRLEYNFEYRF